MCIRDDRLVDKQPTSPKASARLDRTYLSAADGFTLAARIASNLKPSIVKGDCYSRGFGRTSATDRPEVPNAGSRNQPQNDSITERRRRASHAASCGASAPCSVKHYVTRSTESKSTSASSSYTSCLRSLCRR